MSKRMTLADAKPTKLRLWLEANDRTITWLQYETKISYGPLHRTVHGGHCRNETAALIYEAVGHAIPLEDIRDGR